jgi:hypothetical protein
MIFCCTWDHAAIAFSFTSVKGNSKIASEDWLLIDELIP